MNCTVAPTAIIALGGDTTIDVTVAATGVTVSVAMPLIPDRVAVTAVVPEAIPLANPVELIVATDWLASDQVAVELTSAVEPSLYFAVAWNCWVVPADMSAVPGDTAIDVSVFAGCEPPGEEGEPPPQPALTMIMAREKYAARL